jgi:hypothetical protein
MLIGMIGMTKSYEPIRQPIRNQLEKTPFKLVYGQDAVVPHHFITHLDIIVQVLIFDLETTKDRILY